MENEIRILFSNRRGLRDLEIPKFPIVFVLKEFLKLSQQAIFRLSINAFYRINVGRNVPI